MMLELGLDGMKGAECGLYRVQALGLFVFECLVKGSLDCA